MASEESLVSGIIPHYTSVKDATITAMMTMQLCKIWNYGFPTTSADFYPQGAVLKDSRGMLETRLITGTIVPLHTLD
jgi:hypothetical protein